MREEDPQVRIASSSRGDGLDRALFSKLPMGGGNPSSSKGTMRPVVLVET